jgi:dethiobiotin synthetase
MNPRRARGVFLAGTDTDVGTISTEYGVINEDVDSITTASGKNGAAAADINPYCFEWPVSPHIGAERVGIVVDMGRIVTAYERLALDQDIVVVEGAGGWLAPIGPVATMADVTAALQLPVVLVVGLRLGCLNHALLSAQAIARAGAPAWTVAVFTRPRASRCGARTRRARAHGTTGASCATSRRGLQAGSLAVENKA